MQLQQPPVSSNANKNLLTVKAAYCGPCKAALEAVQGHETAAILWIIMDLNVPCSFPISTFHYDARVGFPITLKVVLMSSK